MAAIKSDSWLAKLKRLPKATMDGGYMIFQRTYLCLPDTIDPREKKE